MPRCVLFKALNRGVPLTRLCVDTSTLTVNVDVSTTRLNIGNLDYVDNKTLISKIRLWLYIFVLILFKCHQLSPMFTVHCIKSIITRKKCNRNLFKTLQIEIINSNGKDDRSLRKTLQVQLKLMMLFHVNHFKGIIDIKGKKFIIFQTFLTLLTSLNYSRSTWQSTHPQ